MTFEVFGAYAAGMPRSLHDADALDDFLSAARSSVEKALNNESFLYGQRAEQMFEHVVVALGKVKFIKSEDAGKGWYDGDELSIPDFRVILADGSPLLVEVKNHHAHPINRPFRLSDDYYNGLVRYGTLMGVPVMIAVYWSSMSHWTIVPIEILEAKDGWHFLDVEIAIKENRLAQFGDIHVATTPPLELHLEGDPTKPRSYEVGVASFTVRDVRLYCAHREITSNSEKAIVWLFLMFGCWENATPYVETDESGLPARIVYAAEPPNDSNQGFELIGQLSSIYSRRFAWMTSEKDRVARLDAHVVPGEGAVLIPPDYQGEALPLWRFHLIQ